MDDREPHWYGVPYKGSKNSIAREIVDQLPPAEHFYDLFAGGCAVAHAAILSGKYRHIHLNDADGRGIRLFLGGIRGDYRDERRWISREEFHEKKADDPYIAICWSFGNNMATYLYGKETELLKKQIHLMLTGETVHDRRMTWYKLRHMLEPIHEDGPEKNKAEVRGVESLERLERVQELESLERVQELESLERVQELESLERVQELESLTTFDDYRSVSIEPDSVVYCDPPYAGTLSTHDGEYGANFDYRAFYSWALEQTELTVISEHSMPDGFTPVWSREKVVHMQRGSSYVTEHLYVPSHQLAMWQERAGAQLTMGGAQDGR